MIDNANAPDLALRLQQARRDRGMTMKELADACDIPKSTLESYMRSVDPKKPGLEAILKIADGLGVSVDWLVGRDHRERTQAFDDKAMGMLIFGIVWMLADKLQAAQRRSDVPIITDDKLAGETPGELASWALSRSLEMLGTYDRWNGAPTVGRELVPDKNTPSE